MLAYSCPKKDPGKKLDENRVMGVDVGVIVPAYASINDMTYKKIPVGDNTIHKQKILDEKLRAEKQSAITYNLRDGHGRKTKLDGFDGAGHKSRNRQKTKNQVWAKKIVQEAIKYGCGNIYMEDLICEYKEFDERALFCEQAIKTMMKYNKIRANNNINKMTEEMEE